MDSNSGRQKSQTASTREEVDSTSLQLRELKYRDTNKVEILILEDGQGEDNPVQAVKYGCVRNEQRQDNYNATQLETSKFSRKVLDELKALQIGKVDIIYQPKVLQLPVIVDKLVDKGTMFIIQIKKQRFHETKTIPVLFMNRTCSPPELQEYRNIPYRRLTAFIKEKHAMSALYEQMCVMPPRIKIIEQKLERNEEINPEEMDLYERFCTQHPKNLEAFKKILLDNQEKGNIFLERKN